MAHVKDLSADHVKLVCAKVLHPLSILGERS